MVSPCKTPKAARRGSCSAGSKAAAASSRRGDERMITIKCQRMTADKICEEIEVEVRKCQNPRGNQNSCYAVHATLQLFGFYVGFIYEVDRSLSYPIQVPAPIYDNIRTLNNSDADKSTSATARAGRSKSLGSRLRSIFGGCGKS